MNRTELETIINDQSMIKKDYLLRFTETKKYWVGVQ